MDSGSHQKWTVISLKMAIERNLVAISTLNIMQFPQVLNYPVI